MAGRDDFGIIRSGLLTDARARNAAELYAQRGLAVEDTALATVCGHIGILGLWAMRETDDGVLPGDGLAVVEDVTRTSRGRARVILQTLLDAELLRPVDGGVYLVGFKSCYDSIIDRREANAESKRIARAEAKLAREERARALAQKEGDKKSVTVTSSGRTKDVTRTSGQTSSKDNGRHADVQGTSGLTVLCRAVPCRAVPERSEAKRSDPERAVPTNERSSTPRDAADAAAAVAPEAVAAATSAATASSGSQEPQRITVHPGLPEYMRPGPKKHPRGLPGETYEQTQRRLADARATTDAKSALLRSLLAVGEEDPRYAGARVMLGEDVDTPDWSKRARAALEVPNEPESGVVE